MLTVDIEVFRMRGGAKEGRGALGRLDYDVFSFCFLFHLTAERGSYIHFSCIELYIDRHLDIGSMVQSSVAADQDGS